MQIAVYDSETEYTYQQLVSKAIALQAKLSELSAGKEFPVAILLSRGINLYASQFAVLSNGSFFLPIDPKNPANRTRYLLENSETKIVLVDHTTAALVEDCPPGVTVVNVDDHPSTDAHWPENTDLGSLLKHQPDDLAYMIYTSGSTGQPKGVPIHWSAIDNHNRWFIKEFSIGTNDRCLQIASPGFDISLEEVLPTLRAGASLYPAPKSVLENPRSFFHWIAKHELTVLNIPTALWHTLVPLLAEYQLPDSVRLVLVGGEQVSASVVEQWHSHIDPNQVRLVNAYGPTEVTITCTFCDLYPGQPLSIGRPIANIDCHLIDESNQLVTDCEQPGELYFSGAGLSRGYWNNPEQTRKAFSAFPALGGRQAYRTGDLAKFDRDGNLHFLGRSDTQVKLRGFRIELEEISKTVVRHPSVQHAVVRKLGDVHEQLVCFLVPVNSHSGNKDLDRRLELQLIKFLRSELPEHMLPSQFVFLDQLPLTVGGKIDLQKLESMQQPVSETEITWNTQTESLVADSWKATLGYYPETPQSQFEESGGDSLSAMTFVIELERRFPGRRFGVASISAYPSVVDIAHFIDANPIKESANPNAPIITLVNDEPGCQKDCLLFFHPAGGGGYLYQPLISDWLLKEYSVVMVESPFLTGTIPSVAEPLAIDSIVGPYADAIASQLNLNSKVVATGYSLGGILAFEVANRLHEKGFDIDRVINIDQPTPSSILGASLTQRVLNWLYRLRSPWVNLQDLIETRHKNKLRSGRKTEQEDPAIDEIFQSIQLEDFYVGSENTYEPQPADLDLHLIRGGVFEAKYALMKDYGWTDFSRKLHIHRMYGLHTTLFKEPNINQLIELFNHALKWKEPTD